MAALVIKNLPEKIHRRLKEEATRNRRSMIQHAVLLLEQALEAGATPAAHKTPPLPVELGVRHGHKWIYAAIREGRR
jgi:plasmid stability protein